MVFLTLAKGTLCSCNLCCWNLRRWAIKSELILASKARVAPRNISTPRLELVAAQTRAKQTTIADLIVSKWPGTSYQIEIHFILLLLNIYTGLKLQLFTKYLYIKIQCKNCYTCLSCKISVPNNNLRVKSYKILEIYVMSIQDVKNGKKFL